MLFKLSELIRKTDNLSLPHKGTVVDNNDPKKLNRVKCVIKGIMESSTYSDLPWIHPLLSSTSPSSTTTTPPEINTELWVEFPMGNDSLYQPVYKGYWYSKKNGIAHPDHSSQFIFGVDYPNLYGMQDSTGNYFVVNKKQESMDMEHSSGDHIKVTKNGDIFITGKHNIHIDNEGTLDITNKGRVTLTCVNSDIVVSASVGNVNITALQKVTVKGTAGVDVIGSIVRLASDATTGLALQPTANGVITGLSLCILAGIPHKNGSSTVLASL